jgi:dihydropteroate synthase
MVEVMATHDCGVVIMHMRGTPRDMRERASYQDLLAEVEGELADSVGLALTAGVARECIVLDPGIGFAKGAEQSLKLLRGLRSLAAMGFPLMVGPSRKSFLGEVLGLPPEDRVEGTIAACLAAYQRGALIFRVHDVRAVVRALCVARAIEEGRVWTGS